MSEKNEPKKLSISLLENGLHSLRNGVTSFDKYIQRQEKSKQSAQSKFLLRDSVMMLHHGIELLMKEILIRKSEFLIFEKLDDAANKQKTANSKGVGIFSLDNPPRTVTYEEAINRVEAFVKPDQLTSELRRKLTGLNSLRNQLEHYAIDINEGDIIQLISGIREPLFELLDDALGKDVRPRSQQVEVAWTRIENLARFDNKTEEEVFNTLSQLGGVTIPGRLLSAGYEITLPSISLSENRVQMYSSGTYGFIPDITGDVDGVPWVIEVKGSSKRGNLQLPKMIELRNMYNYKFWIIVLDSVPPLEKDLAKAAGFYITDLDSWKEIKNFIPKQGNLFEEKKVS